MTDRGVVWAVTVLLLTANGCGGGGGGGGGGASETWSGTFSGTALGPFICLAGTDGWYDESASVTFDVGGTLSTRLQASGTADFAGTFSGAETAHEASGTGCAPPPSVSSTSLGATAVNVHKVGA